MPSRSLPNASDSLQTETETLERIILDHLSEQTVIGMDALIVFMPQYSWSQIFYTVDRLARCGRIVLRRHHCDYTLFSTHYAA